MSPKMSSLLVRVILDELRDENKTLFNDLCFEHNLNQILDNIRNYSLVLINNCKCNTNEDIKQKINQLNANYVDLKASKVMTKINGNIKQTFREIKEEVEESDEDLEEEISPQNVCQMDCNSNFRLITELIQQKGDKSEELVNNSNPSECQTVFE